MRERGAFVLTPAPPLHVRRSVAALSRDTPLLNPFPFASGGPLAHYESAGNGGRPLRGIFFLDDLNTFVRALRDPALRHRDSTARTRSLASGRNGIDGTQKARKCQNTVPV